MRTRKESEHERRLSRQLNVQVHNYIRETIISVKFDFGRKLNEFALHSLFPYQLRIWKVHFVLFMFFFCLSLCFSVLYLWEAGRGRGGGGRREGVNLGTQGETLTITLEIRTSILKFVWHVWLESQRCEATPHPTQCFKRYTKQISVSH